jgi:transcriptional regulator with XRE-family HTH domain
MPVSAVDGGCLVSAGTVPGTGFGELLRRWRTARRLSQLQLSAATGVSSRHLSFLETGRGRPSRQIVLFLAEQLDVPLPDRNDLLLAAGFAPAYGSRSLDDPAMVGVRESIRHMLDAHEPYPALVMDGRWNRLLANQGTRALLGDVAPFLLAEPVNVLRLTLHPEGMAPRIENLAEWSEHLLLRLRHRITRQGDDDLAKLHDELASYPGVRAVSDHPAEPGQRVVLPFEYRTDQGVLRFLNTTTSFATPLDAALSEVFIEAFYPADETTRRVLASRPLPSW